MVPGTSIAGNDTEETHKATVLFIAYAGYTRVNIVREAPSRGYGREPDMACDLLSASPVQTDAGAALGSVLGRR